METQTVVLVPTRDLTLLTLQTCPNILYYSLERATATCALHNYTRVPTATSYLAS
jgi:hypothetical protein